MMRYALLLLTLTTMAFGQAAPSVTSVTNAALPSLNYPPSAVHLAPRSMASIFGVNLAATTISAAPPWPEVLGGIEVHLVASSFSPYSPEQGVTGSFSSTEEFAAKLIYVSPTQINFVVPDVDPTVLWKTRIVIVKNGTRFDNLANTISGVGLVTIDAVLWSNYNVVYGVGYDCLFSFSLTDADACGLSWSQGQHRAMLGAITDAVSGQLITPQNPISQGQLITVWLTGLTGLIRNSNTGLLQQEKPLKLAFGVAQNGKDLPGTVSPGEFGEYGQFLSNSALWAGESPEYMGLDQVNVRFPVCSTTTKATAEKRYDAFLTYTNVNSYSGVENNTTARVYLPFVVRVGDPDCQWTVPLTNTNTTLAASINPSAVGQAVTFTATVSPSDVTGTVAFSEGVTVIATSAVSNGRAAFTTSQLAAGNHSIVATYGGDAKYAGSSATRMQTVKAATTTTITSNANPSVSGQSLIFTAIVSPSDATGTVTFYRGTSTLGVGTVSGGKAMCGVNNSCSTAGIGAGTYSIKATYNGDDNYGSSSGTLNQVVRANTTTTLALRANTANLGQSVLLTATVSPCCIATGTVTFLDGSNVLGSAVIQGTKATLSTSALSVGTHSITARYSGDTNYIGSTSNVATLTVWSLSLTSTPNPSAKGQMVTLSACNIPTGAPGTISFTDGGVWFSTINNLSSPCATWSGNAFAAGTHSITARYTDSYGGDSSASITQVITAQ